MALLWAERDNICRAGFLQAASGGSGSPSTSHGNEMQGWEAEVDTVTLPLGAEIGQWLCGAQSWCPLTALGQGSSGFQHSSRVAHQCTLYQWAPGTQHAGPETEATAVRVKLRHLYQATIKIYSNSKSENPHNKNLLWMEVIWLDFYLLWHLPNLCNWLGYYHLESDNSRDITEYTQIIQTESKSWIF